MKFKLFTFLKEKNILLDIKTKLLSILGNKKEDFKTKATSFIQQNTPLAQNKLVDLIMNNIELPFYLKPFKKIVKKTIIKNLNKLADFILSQIDKY